MANDLTRKGEDFDFALDEPKKTIPLGETVRKAESGHISDRPFIESYSHLRTSSKKTGTFLAHSR